MEILTKEKFTKKLLAIQRARKIREARAEERIWDSSAIESCLFSIDRRSKNLNGRRCI